MILSLFLAQATSSASAPAVANPMMQLVPLLFIGVIFYFLLIRPQQKQRKNHQKLVESIKTGDKVITSSGIHGIIANVKERTVMLKIAENVKIEIDRAAVTAVERNEE
ncbi:MAG TPA: preprotein translocase subunit YajC [Chthoniobacterales bacterium]|nr:preprotein translocase subunit YajC [Chthoniobacterales bacterium]